MRAELIFTLEGVTRRVPIVDVLVLGRGSKSAIVIEHPSVSRTHCKVVRHDDQLTVVDLGSDNGTYVNGGRVQGPTRLAAGDKLKIGPLELTLQLTDEPPAAQDTRVRTLWPPPSALGGRQEAPQLATLAVVDPSPGAETTAFRDAVRMGDFALMVLVGNLDHGGEDRDAAMGEVRRAVRDVAKINGAPDAVMRTLNGALRALKAAAGAVCGRLDLTERRLTYSVVGHDPPWLVRRGQKAVQLPASPSVELGRVPLARFTQHKTELAEGDVAIFASRELSPLLKTVPVAVGNAGAENTAEWILRARGQGVSLPWQGGCAVCAGIALRS